MEIIPPPIQVTYAMSNNCNTVTYKIIRKPKGIWEVLKPYKKRWQWWK